MALWCCIFSIVFCNTTANDYCQFFLIFLSWPKIPGPSLTAQHRLPFLLLLLSFQVVNYSDDYNRHRD